MNGLETELQAVELSDMSLKSLIGIGDAQATGRGSTGANRPEWRATMGPAGPAAVGRDRPLRGTVARRAGLDSAAHRDGRRSRRVIDPGALQPQFAVLLGEVISEFSLIFDDAFQILGTSVMVSGGSLGIIDEALQGAGALIRFVELGVKIGDLLLRRLLEKKSVLQHADQARLNSFRGP
jgi:hypothetical protein